VLVTPAADRSQFHGPQPALVRGTRGNFFDLHSAEGPFGRADLSLTLSGDHLNASRTVVLDDCSNHRDTVGAWNGALTGFLVSSTRRIDSGK